MDTTGLALFDLDGTITRVDTMLVFARHCRGTARYWLGMLWLSPWLVAHRVGLLRSDHAKERFLRHFLGGMGREALARAASSFADVIDANLRPGALARLRWHKEQGHDVLVVSASLGVWLRPWAERHGLRLLCTEGRFEGEVFTGALATPNNNGPEKERRIRETVDVDGYERRWGYGDSDGDREMLALCDEVAFQPFRGPAPNVHDR